MIRNSADAQEFFACHDARFPPLYSHVRAIVNQLDRAIRALS